MTRMDKFRRLRELLATPDRWWRIRGIEVINFSSDIDRTQCLQLAARRAGMDLRARVFIEDAIRRMFPDRYIPVSPGVMPNFNDHAETTHADVLMIIDRAAAAAEASEPVMVPV